MNRDEALAILERGAAMLEDPKVDEALAVLRDQPLHTPKPRQVRKKRS